MSKPSRRLRFLVPVAVLTVVLGALVYARGTIRDAIIEARKPAVPREEPAVRPSATVPTLSATTVLRPSTPTPVLQPSPTPARGAVNLAVPFFSQAPRGDWSLPWQEACEEASAILVDAFWRGDALSVDAMERNINAAVAWQQSNFGYYQHTTAAQTATMLRELYGYRRVDVEYGVGVPRIAEHIRAGRPVIVPLAGRELGNPYYTAPGPIYHMMVVKGIAENGDVITNDVGTRHGRNLTYAPAVFEAAMHDVPTGGDRWPEGSDPVTYLDTGAKAIVVVYPN